MALCNRDAGGYGLVRHIDHMGLARWVEVAEAHCPAPIRGLANRVRVAVATSS